MENKLNQNLTEDNIYKHFIEQTPNGFSYCKVICDENDNPMDFEFLEVNSALIKLTGYKGDVFVGKKRSELDFEGTYDDILKNYGETAISGVSREFEKFYEGLNQWYRVFVYSPKKYYVMSLFTDITMIKKELEEKTIIMTALNDIVFELDENLVFINVFVSDESILFMPKQMFLGKNLMELFPKELSDQFALTLQRAYHSNRKESIIYKSPIPEDNKWYKAEVSFLQLNRRYIVSIADISEQKRNQDENNERQDKIEYLSFHDTLTGLYNRRYLEDAVTRLDTTSNLPIAIMVLDVNALKLTNDAFGHEMGDQLIKTVANILTKVCDQGEIIARIGGDEFAILLPNTDEDQTRSIKKRILREASNTKLDSIIVSVAVGFAVKYESNQNIKETQKSADNDMYRDKLKHGRSMRNRTIELLISNINTKYSREQIHTERVSEYCEAIAKAMNLSDKDICDIKVAGSLHDVGKVLIPPEILNKEEPLTPEEWQIIKKHPETSYQILKGVSEYAALADSALYHHERWDGTGYPHGLKGDKIPLFARIIGIADAYEAMTAQRVFQRAKSKEEAIAELIDCSGTQFDPDLVDVLINKVIYQIE